MTIKNTMGAMETALTFNDALLEPRYSTVLSRKLVDTSVRLTKTLTLKVPLISSPMDTVTEAKLAIALAQLGGLGIIHRFVGIKDQVLQVKAVKKHGLSVGAAVGVVGDYLDRCSKLKDAGADLIVVDVAHGHAQHVGEAVKAIRIAWPRLDIIAGNVATPEGVEFLAKAGANIVRVGVGPGSRCVTRIVTGCGVPQLTAIINCSKVGVPIVADGGLKNSGDVVKALAGGATAVMIGNLFAGTEESPGHIIIENEVKKKMYRGMASHEATAARKQKENLNTNLDEIVPEGVATTIPYKGKMGKVVNQLVGGLRSGMSYCGASNLEELRKNAKFVRITQAGWVESLPT